VTRRTAFVREQMYGSWSPSKPAPRAVADLGPVVEGEVLEFRFGDTGPAIAELAPAPR